MPEHALPDPVEALQLRARRPPSCESLRPPPLARGARIAIVLLVAIAHLVFFRWMETRHPLTRAAGPGHRIEIVFLPATREPPALPLRRRGSEPPVHDAVVARNPVTSSSSPSSRPRDNGAMRATFVEPRSSVIPTPAVAAPASGPVTPLYRTDGAIQLPQQVVDDLEAIDNDRRSFSFQHAGLGRAKGFAQRRAPLDYEATRFDAQWIDEKDVVTEALEKAMEKTTVTVRIPIPRAPGSKVVCKISLLAVGGACGIANNGEGYVVALDDPTTLDAKEAEQCRLWWEEVVAAPSEARLRAARERYEAQCRKPLAAAGKPSLPAEEAGAEPR
jgi:hypothetical protein